MYLSSVEGNVKSGVDARLGPRTLVVGPNGAGKTSIVIAAELLLTGGCEVGRKPSVLASLATLGTGILTLEGALADPDGAVSFSILGSAARASRPTWTRDGASIGEPLGASMSRSLAALLRGDPAQTLRPELIRVACGALDVPSLVQAYIPGAFRAAWDDAWAEVRAEADSDADALAEMAAWFRADARAAGRVVLDAAPVVPEDAPADDEIADAKQRLVRARDAEDAARRRQALSEELGRLRSELGSGAIVETDEAWQKTVLDALDGALAGHRFLAEARARAKNGGVIKCPTCEHVISLDALEGLRVRAMNRAGKAKVSLAEATRRWRLQGRVRELEAQQRSLPTARAGESASDAESRLMDLLRRKARVEGEEGMRAEAARAAASADAAKALSLAADRMVAAALEEGVRGLERHVNEHLADGKIGIVLFDGGKSVCRVQWTGKVRGKSVVAPLHALSGAQHADVVRAFACAWSTTAKAAATLVVVDDVALDREHLEAVMEGLEAPESCSQAIVCTLDDYGLARDNWTVVRL